MTDTLYHSLLRVSALLVALLLVFDSGILFPISAQLSNNTMSYLAQSVGVFAQIEPNELNTITAELTRREAELNDREAVLREIEARTYETDNVDYSTYVLSLILFVLTTLIVFNYVLDWRRAHAFVRV